MWTHEHMVKGQSQTLLVLYLTVQKRGLFLTKCTINDSMSNSLFKMKWMKSIKRKQWLGHLWLFHIENFNGNWIKGTFTNSMITCIHVRVTFLYFAMEGIGFSNISCPYIYIYIYVFLYNVKRLYPNVIYTE